MNYYIEIEFNYVVFRMVDDEETQPSGVHATKMGPDDIQFHVHSDHGTGGHWCAKIFFFSLLAILLGLIGLILLENRGLSDRKFQTFKKFKIGSIIYLRLI